MNESIVSSEAKARLTEAVKNYAPPAPKKYRALEEVKECIIELRKKQASYKTIRTMLHDNAGIDVTPDHRPLLPRGAGRSQGEEAALSEDANDRTTASRPRGIGSASAVWPVTVTRTAQHRFKGSLARQHRCRPSRRP